MGFFTPKAADYQELGVYLAKLEPKEFVGAARYLHVDIMTYDKDMRPLAPRSAEDIFNDMINAYKQLSRSERRYFLKVVKAAAT